MNKYITTPLFILFVVLNTSSLVGQDAGANVFNTDFLHEVRIELDQPNYWNLLVGNYEMTGDGANVPYIMGNVAIDGEQVDSVGVRLKGFTSFWTESDKKPIKLDFNEYVPGKRLDGLRKLNLNNGTGDPGLHRDVLCYQMIRNMGVNAPRTSFAKVYINDIYWGLYQIIEQVDKEYLERNFANPDGNLFKNKGWNNFEYQGNDPFIYDETYDLKTNEEEYDWSGFIDLMQKVNSLSNQEFISEFPQIFNIEDYLKILAVDVATDNWDSNLEHGRNWYIYEDDKTGQFQWVPWDYNFSMGGTFGFGGNDCFIFTELGEYTDGTNTVSFKDFGFFSSTPEYLWNFGDGNTSTDQNPTHTYAMPGKYTVCLATVIDNDCSDTRCIEIDTEYDSNECNSLNDSSTPDNSSVFFQFLINQNPSCCDTWSGFCQDEFERIVGTSDGGGFEVDQRGSERVLINRILDIPQFYDQYRLSLCQLLENVMVEDRIFQMMDFNKNIIDQAVQEDPNFLFSYGQFDSEYDADDSRSLKNYISNRIESLTTDLSSDFTCPERQAAFGFQEVVINEIMASNDSTSVMVDQDGDHDDWIELYNTTDIAIDLTGMYLSDDPADLLKWPIPDGTLLASDDYLIIWADKDEEQAGLHASFKLAKDGESIYLSNADGSAVDSMSYDEQMTNVAYARFPNGTGDFRNQEATFDRNNNIGTVSTNEENLLAFSLSPNPADNQLNIQLAESYNAESFVEIYSVDAQLLSKASFIGSSITLDTRSYQNGMYFLRVWNDSGKSAAHKIVVQH